MTNEQKLLLLQKLEEAYYSGVREIEFNDRKLKYDTAQEMRNRISSLKKQLGLNKKKTTYNPTYNKGV